MLIAVVAIIVIVAFFVWASYSISGGIYLKSLCKNPQAGKVVALTFDDGVDEHLTPRVLDILKKYDIKATFFVIGQKAERYPEIVKRIVEEGHIVGNHSYKHSNDFPLGCPGCIVDELSKADKVLERITGSKVSYFRPPYGVTNPMISRAVCKMGYQSIGWSIRSLDTMNKSRDEILERVVGKLHDGAVILLHDDREHSPELAEKIIDAILLRGYRVVSIEELFNLK